MHVRPVTQKDLYDYARVASLAMWNDEMMAYVAPYKDQYPDSFLRYCLHRTKLRWYRGEFLYFCVTDENDADWTGEEVIMGGACYSTTVKTVQKPVQSGWLGNKFEQLVIKTTGTYSSFFGLDWSADQKAEQVYRGSLAANVFDSYFASLPAEQKEAMQDQHWELESLGTHPDFRRRGVATALLKKGFERASEDGVPLVLCASIVGEKLYLSTGFKEVNRLDMVQEGWYPDERLKEMDLGLGKGKGLSWAAMAWEPPTLRGRGTEKDS